MKKIVLAALAISTLAVSACTKEQSVLDLPPGKYEKTTKSTNSDGTDVERKNVTHVGVDSQGNKTAIVKDETTRDPKGLFNKTTDESTRVIESR